jgi:hypothetical protein
MPLDSLLLALLVGLIPSPSNADQTPLPSPGPSSINVRLTVEIAGTVRIDASPQATESIPRRVSLDDLSTESRSLTVTALGPVYALATAWGADCLFNEESGYLSVFETAGLNRWRLRTTMIKSLINGREERLRWSLVYGIL